MLANSKFADIVELSPGQMVGAAQLGYITPWSKCSLIDPKDARWVEYGTKLGSYAEMCIRDRNSAGRMV